MKEISKDFQEAYNFLSLIEDKVAIYIDLLMKINLLCNSLEMYPKDEVAEFSLSELEEYLEKLYYENKDKIIKEFIEPLIPSLKEDEIYILDKLKYSKYCIYVIKKKELEKIKIVDLLKISNSKKEIAKAIFYDLVEKQFVKLRDLKNIIEIRKEGIEKLDEFNF